LMMEIPSLDLNFENSPTVGSFYMMIVSLGG